MVLSKRQRRARREREKALKACRCVGRSGSRKVLYRSRVAAVNASMRGRVGVSDVYRCPSAAGWHTTRVGRTKEGKGDE